MTGSPPVPAGNISPYPLQVPAHASDGPKGPVIRTPEPRISDVPVLALAFFGGAILVGTAAIALALSARD